MPFEEVRDFFFARQNYVAELDESATQLAAVVGAMGTGARTVGDALVRRLKEQHGVSVVWAHAQHGTHDGVQMDGSQQRHFDPHQKLLRLSPHLDAGQHAFQMATQLAFLEMGDSLQRLAADPGLTSDASRALARIGLANYFAGAVLLPYDVFLRAAESLRYDIDQLGRTFGVVSRRCATASAHCSGLTHGACRFSSSAWTVQATSPNGSRPPISISPRWAAPALCGMCTRPLPSRAGC